MSSLQEVMHQAEELWPLELAEEWDSVGLVCGDPAQDVTKIIFCVDPTQEVVAEAIECGAQLIIAHHPLFLKGVNGVGADTFKGSIVHCLIQNNIALYTAHTNADSAVNGVNEQLAEVLGVHDIKPLVASSLGPDLGMGRVGDLEEETTLGEFAQKVAEELPTRVGGIRVAGDNAKPVKKVALCGGSGDSIIDVAAASGADVYVTSDLRHHPALEAVQNSDMALIDTAHSASEGVWLAGTAEEFSDLGYETFISEDNSDPWDSLVVQGGGE